MRPVPRFWTAAEGSATDPEGLSYRLRLQGWSVSSLQDAAAVAAQRLEEALGRVRAGQPLGGGYYPRLPLREEVLTDVLADDGTLLAVVTRNRYGAEVLNTDRVLVADVDLASPTPTGGGGGLLGRLLGRKAPEPDPAGGEAAAVDRVAALARSRPDLGVHLYRTAAGLRVLVTGGDLPPGSAAAEQILTDLESDPVYVLLCRTLETYRARLTPKPWRLGGVPVMPRSWPDRSEPGAVHHPEWVARYQRASGGYATCRLVSRSGPEPTGEDRLVLELHDGVTRVAETGLPLA